MIERVITTDSSFSGSPCEVRLDPDGDSLIIDLTIPNLIDGSGYVVLEDGAEEEIKPGTLHTSVRLADPQIRELRDALSLFLAGARA